MNRRRTVAGLLAASLTLACAGAAFAQEKKYPDILDAKPMFKAGPNHMELAPKAPAAALVQWNGSFVDLTKKTIDYTMIGTDPSAGGVSTTVPVVIVPVKMVYGKKIGNMTFDPMTAKASDGLTIINNIIASPLFNPGVNFTQGGTNLGTTQYEDAFQRGNFWKFVKTKAGKNYHVLLSTPTVLPEMTINVTALQGKVINNPFGSGVVGLFADPAMDAAIQTYMANSTSINPGVLPIFITYDIYLGTSGTCCIGGYHNANGAQPSGQTYSYSTYVDSVGAFAQDVSALSHELGEWMDDPFVDNHVNCQDNSLMEVGDPLEGLANYGAFPYTLGGFTYNLQSLVFIGYFGGPVKDSVHKWLSFQNDEPGVCPGQ
jgi:hypothetical protein